MYVCVYICKAIYGYIGVYRNVCIRRGLYRVHRGM